MTNIPCVPMKIQVWVWSQQHIETRLGDSLKKKDVYYDMDRKIAEVDLSNAQFENGVDTHIKLELNLKTIPGSSVINLQFRMQSSVFKKISLTPLIYSHKCRSRYVARHPSVRRFNLASFNVIGALI